MNEWIEVPILVAISISLIVINLRIAILTDAIIEINKLLKK